MTFNDDSPLCISLAGSARRPSHRIHLIRVPGIGIDGGILGDAGAGSYSGAFSATGYATLVVRCRSSVKPKGLQIVLDETIGLLGQGN